MTEQLGGALGVVEGGVRLFIVKRNARALARLGQHRLAERQAGEGSGVEGGKRMERIALEAGRSAAAMTKP